MGTYIGYVNEIGFRDHLVDFTKKLDESVERMRKGEEVIKNESRR